MKKLPKIAAYTLARLARFRGAFATDLPGPIESALLSAGLIEVVPSPSGRGAPWNRLTMTGRRAVLVWGELDGRRYAERGAWALAALASDGYELTPEARIVVVLDRQPCQVRSRRVTMADWRDVRARLAQQVLT